jgi:hypothetical protein
VSHEHPRGADLDWYREHLAEEDLEAQRRIIAPFNDRRPPQPIVIERKRPRREAGADEREFLDASS